jgi:hypothetical protein
VAQRTNPVGLLRQACLLWPGEWHAVGLAEASPSAAGEAAGCRCPELGPSGARQREPARQTGAEVGSKSTGRGEPGTKRHFAADVQRTPFDLTLSGANRHHSRELVPAPDAVPGLRARHQGRLSGDLPGSTPTKAYDRRRCHRECRSRGNVPRIARSIESGKQATVPPRQSWNAPVASCCACCTRGGALFPARPPARNCVAAFGRTLRPARRDISWSCPQNWRAVTTYTVVGIFRAL